ncbi:MAG: alpha/beta hydrolase [Gemmatimonadales bacterium]
MTRHSTGPTTWEPYPNETGGAVRLLVRHRVLSPELRNFRDVIVALPPDYDETDRRYPVVYMQDGQNLFDPATAYAGDWRLTATLSDLGERGFEAIVVGIPNAGVHRLREYSPFADRRRGGGQGDRYVRFITDTLKPMVDRAFRTDPSRAATSIAGSSMGGLISLYALFRRSDVFGAAAALSPSLWFANRAIMTWLAEIRHYRPGRLYVDIGLDEPDSAVADVRALRTLLTGLRPRAGVFEFDFVEDEAGAHDEATWGRRVTRALPFLLGVDPAD